MRQQDFFLASSEGYDLTEPRRCWIVKPLRTNTRDDLVLVAIHPPLIGQAFGLGAQDIDQVILAPRHEGVTITKAAHKWPIAVHVARPLIKDVESRRVLHSGEIEEIAWAEIYPDENAARAKMILT